MRGLKNSIYGYENTKTSFISNASNECIDHDDDDDDDELELWTREETPLLSVSICSSEQLVKGESTFIDIHLRQFGSSDDQKNRCGIHSCVWDGGLGLVAYLRDNLPTLAQDGTLYIDLGSGTGVVGIGIAAILQNNSTMSDEIDQRVLLTDLDEALPLLQENVELNSGNRSNVMTASTASVESLCRISLLGGVFPPGFDRTSRGGVLSCCGGGSRYYLPSEYI